MKTTFRIIIVVVGCMLTRISAQPLDSNEVTMLTPPDGSPATGSVAPERAEHGSRLTTAYPAKPAHTALDNRYRDDVIVVKFRDGLHIRLHAGSLTDFASGVLGDITTRAVLARVGAGRWERVHSLPEDKLDNLRRNAERNLARPVADLNLYFHLFLAPGTDASAMIDAFNALDIVEMAQGVPTPVPAPLPPNYDPNQGYLNVAPAGIGARFVWSLAGGTGSNIRLADLEYSWNFQHADLPTATLLGSPPNDPFNDDNHGTAVLGEIFALANGWGVTGAAYGTTAYVVATNTGEGSGVWNVAGAITTALGTLQAGDAILIEQQYPGPRYTGDPPGTQFGLVPVEWYKPTYDAIVAAVGGNCVVVEAAGNGEQDLDDPIYSTENGGHWPFLPENDSGALIVGAGAAPASFGGTDVDRSRLWFSNYGSTVDLQGWGERVYTLGYGDLYSGEGVDYYYTDTFGGTSSASPNVAAAAVLIQSVYKSAGGDTLPPAGVKNLLRQTGSPQQSGVYPMTQNIGPRPDAAAVLALTGACCDPSGTCAVTTLSNCTGTWLGAGSMCSPNPCPPPSAFVDSSFESGTLEAWTITPTSNGQTLVQTVEVFDIDGPGALTPSNAAKLCVGQVQFQYGVQEGIELTQTLALQGGLVYTISFDYAAKHTDPYNTNGEGGVFSIIVNGDALATGALGEMPPDSEKYGSISAQLMPSVSGNYIVGARITRDAQPDPLLCQYLDNMVPSGPSLPTGACCQPGGSCAVTTPGACTPPGTWQGAGTTCTPNPCSQLGDLNCDGQLNVSDIAPFMLALLNAGGYAGAYPDCDRMLADCNGDGSVDGRDIQSFVALLLGG